MTRLMKATSQGRSCQMGHPDTARPYSRTRSQRSDPIHSSLTDVQTQPEPPRTAYETAMPRIVTERMCPMSSHHYSLIRIIKDAHENLTTKLPNATKIPSPRPRSLVTNSV